MYCILLHIKTLSCLNLDDSRLRDREEDEPMEAIIGQLVVSIVPGDLVHEKTDAILNPTDQFFSVGRVSKKILEAGGHSIQDECNNFKGTHYLTN